MCRIVFTALAVSSLLVCRSFAQNGAVESSEQLTPASEKQASDDKAIRATGESFTRAYNQGDATAVAAHFTVDADYVGEEGRVLRGRKAIEEDFAELFSDGPKLKIKVNIESLRFVAPNVAIEDGATDVFPAPPGPPADRRYTAVHVKQDGKWLVASVRDSRTVKPSNYERLKGLAWMIGDWVDEGEDSLIETSSRWAANKNYILRKYDVRIEGVRSLSGVQRIGWDPLSGRIKSWVFDSNGGFGEAHWRLQDDIWIVEATGVLQDGTTATATNTFRVVDGDTFTWTSQNRIVGGESVADIEEVTIVRKPPGPSE